jgi:hypothetical protein
LEGEGKGRVSLGGYADTSKDFTDLSGESCIVNHSRDAAVAVAVYQLVSEAVVLAVGAHAWVGEIHLVFPFLVGLIVSLFQMCADVKVFRRITYSYCFGLTPSFFWGRRIS